MAIELINEVLDYAPAGLTPQERLAAIVFAEDARLFNRAGEERHRHLARKILTPLDDKQFQLRIGVNSAKKVQELAQSLARKGVLENVQRGQKHRAAEYRIKHLAPPQQAENWGAEASQDPGNQGAEDGTADLSTPESGAQNGLSTPESGPQHPGKWGASSVVRKKTPSLPLPQQLLRKAELGLTEDEETSFIVYANAIGTTGHKGPKWWRKVESEGDLPGLVAAWRATQAAMTNARDSPATRSCAACGDHFTPSANDTHPCCPGCRPKRTP